MINYANPYGQGALPNPPSSFRQIQEMFPQPQGSIYSINTPTDIGNVPIGSTGLSVAICFPEQLMYIKSFQNGSPVLMAYRVTPYSREEKPTEPKQETPTAEERLDKIEKQLAALINATSAATSNEGGKFDGLL